jgi:uncharacterized protein (DUF1330 family)
MELEVRLWVRDGKVEGFEAFDEKAALVMAKHGGRIVSRHRPEPAPDAPFEIHVVTFPDEEAFAAYRSDPETEELAAEREQVVARTEIVRMIGHG